MSVRILLVADHQHGRGVGGALRGDVARRDVDGAALSADAVDRVAAARDDSAALVRVARDSGSADIHPLLSEDRAVAYSPAGSGNDPREEVI